MRACVCCESALELPWVSLPRCCSCGLCLLREASRHPDSVLTVDLFPHSLFLLHFFLCCCVSAAGIGRVSFGAFLGRCAACPFTPPHHHLICSSLTSVACSFMFLWRLAVSLFSFSAISVFLFFSCLDSASLHLLHRLQSLHLMVFILCHILRKRC